MPERISIVGLGGSLARPSTSLAALEIALAGAAEHGADITLFDLHEQHLPFYSPEIKSPPACVLELVDAVHAANGLIWSSPLYHGTVSGAFKNALDWLQLLSDREPAYLTDKVVGMIATAGGIQGLQAINTMEFVVRALRGWAVPLVIPVGRAWEVFDDEGRLSDARLQEQLRALGHEVVRAATQLALGRVMLPEAARACAQVQPLTKDEARSDRAP